MRMSIEIALLWAASAALAACSSPLTLARNGMPAATIVLAAAPNLSAQYAAPELQWHVQRITSVYSHSRRCRSLVAAEPVTSERQRRG